MYYYVGKKKTHSLEIIHMDHKTSSSYALAVLRSYIDFAISICSNNIFSHEGIKITGNIADKSGYKKQ